MPPPEPPDVRARAPSVSRNPFETINFAGVDSVAAGGAEMKRPMEGVGAFLRSASAAPSDCRTPAFSPPLAAKDLSARDGEALAATFNQGFLHYIGLLGVASQEPANIAPTIAALTDPASDRYVHKSERVEVGFRLTADELLAFRRNDDVLLRIRITDLFSAAEGPVKSLLRNCLGLVCLSRPGDQVGGGFVCHVFQACSAEMREEVVRQVQSAMHIAADQMRRTKSGSSSGTVDELHNSSDSLCSGPGAPRTPSSSHASVAGLSEVSSSSYAEPSPHGHRRVHSDGSMGVQARPVSSGAHSPRSTIESRLLARARRVYDRLLTLPPGSLLPATASTPTATATPSTTPTTVAAAATSNNNDSNDAVNNAAECDGTLAGLESHLTSRPSSLTFTSPTFADEDNDSGSGSGNSNGCEAPTRSASFIAPLRKDGLTPSAASASDAANVFAASIAGSSASSGANGAAAAAIGPRARLRAGTARYRVCDMLSILVASKDFSARENALSFLQQLHRAGILVGPQGGLSDNADECVFVFHGKSRCESQSSEIGVVDSVTTEEEMMILADDVAGLDAAALAHAPDPAHLGDLLLRAVKLGGSGIVRRLLECGANANYHSDGVLPPLHSATVKGDRKSMTLLLEHGADTELRSPSGKTPLMLAASNRKLLECAFLLLEYGAQVNAADDDGVSAATIQPELVEAQRHLCTAAVAGMASSSALLGALTFVVRLAGNCELRCELADQLSALPLTTILGCLCETQPTAATLTSQLLLSLFPPSNGVSRVAMEAAVLRMLLDLLALQDSVVSTVLSILHAAALALERDCCAQMALLSMDPLFSLLLRAPPHHATVTAVLARVTQFPKAQPALGDEDHHALLLSAFRTVTLAPDASEASIEAILRVLCNACMFLPNQPLLAATPLISLVRPFLTHPAAPVRFAACKCLLLLGETDVGGVQLFALCPLEVVTATQLDEEGAWARIKAAPIETVVGVMTEPGLPGRMCQPLFLACEHYWHPILLFRLIAHRHRCHAPANPVPPAHQQIFTILRVWFTSSSGLFISVPGLALELRTFLSSLFVLGGPYRAATDELGQLAVRLAQPLPDPYALNYAHAPHEKLYQAMAVRVTLGRLPCSIDLAQCLAGLKIHIDDMERGGRPRARGDTALPSFKLKAVIFSGAIKGRDLKQMLARVGEEYAKICDLSIRDAKHAYLETAAVASNYGCDDFYLVKELVDKRRVARQLGVGKYSIVLLDDQTKALVRREPHAALRRWEVLPVRGFDLLKSASAQLVLTFAAATLALYGDEPMLQTIASLLLERTAFLAQLPLDARQPREIDDELDLDLFELDPTEETPMNTPRHSPSTTPRASPPPAPRSASLSHSQCSTPAAFSPPQSPAHHHGSINTSLLCTPPSAPLSTSPASPLIRTARSNSVSTTSLSSPSLAALPAAAAAGHNGEINTAARRLFTCNCPPFPDVGEMQLSALTLPMLLARPIEIARQLTVSTHAVFLRVTGRQMIDRVVHNRRAVDSPADLMVARFNKVSLWVTTELLQIPNAAARAAAIAGFIATAKECVRLDNFNDAFCVVAGLDSAAVKRLSDTWDLVPDAAYRDYQDLETLLSPDENFRSYRARADELRAPAVPYLGMFLRDLTLINIGNPDFFRGHANVAKWRQMLRQLKRINDLQQQNYNFLVVHEIQAYIANFVVLTDEKLFEISKEFQGTLTKRASKNRLGGRRASQGSLCP